MLAFWQSIFYSKLAAPIFAWVANLMGVTPQVCKEYCTSGMIMYGFKWFVIFVLLCVAIWFIVLKGYLNPGNLPKYNVSTLEAKEGSPLKDKNLIFLGSSVTRGFGSYQQSFVDMIAKTTGANVQKYAVSGTTLVDKKGMLGESYPHRLKEIDPKSPCDIFVCQLSTNDATKKFAIEDIRKDTQGIIDYVKQTWNCPIVFYTNPEYNDENYKKMVDMINDMAKDGDIQVIDLWHDAQANEKQNKSHTALNGVHPTKKGYQVWTPIITEALEAIAQGKKIPERARYEGAEKLPSGLGKKILTYVLAAILVLAGTIGASTVQQLVTVKGLKNEGNSDKYNPENTAPLASQPIKGKKLFWLGSSVFQGFGAGGTSPALWVDAQEGTSSVIEIKGGTFLASVDGEIGSGLGSIDASTSYTNRLRNHDAKTDPGIDLVVVQLSTNDSKGFCPLGEVLPADKKNFDDFDLTTTAGSLEAITAYARDVWGARTLVITGTEFIDEMTYSGGQHADIYLDMIDVCHQIDEKWGDQFVVLDLWHNEPMYEGITMGDTLWRSYMSDAIHPTKKGYLEWWGPYVNAAIEGMLK